MDGDGDLDAIVANEAQNNTLWLNDGAATFTSQQSLGALSARGVEMGDLDGDGDLDAYLANISHGDTVWFNDGNGNFTDSGQSLGTSAGRRVRLGDLDGDGDLDAFVAGSGKVWTNNGIGTFSDSGQSIDANSRSARLGDLDGDGDLDIFSARYNNPSKVWLNNGSGTFSDSGLNLGTYQSEGTSVADIDGDGDLDAIVVNRSNQANQVYFNNSSTANTAPTAPTGLTSNVNGSNITLSWSAGSDSETPTNMLSYQVVVTASNGVSQTVPAHADLSNGYRGVPGLGNASLRLTLPLTITVSGTYQWSVQTIDSGWKGSAFATQNNFVRSQGNVFVIPPRERTQIYLPLVVK